MVLYNDTDPVELATQSWIMYSVGMTLIVLRMGAQIKRHGLKGLKPDDYVMCLTAVRWFQTSHLVLLSNCVLLSTVLLHSYDYHPDRFGFWCWRKRFYR